MPARIRSLEIDEGGDRNFVERSVNQADQNGLVEERSVRQKYFVGPLEESEEVSWGCMRGGTETRADVVFRMVRERRCQSIALGMEANDAGRVRRKLSIDDRPSMADPSTTSRTIKPRREAGGEVEPRWVMTAPPSEWPIRRMGGSVGQESLMAVALRTNRRSEARVERLRSRNVDGGFVVRP